MAWTPLMAIVAFAIIGVIAQVQLDWISEFTR